MNLTNSRILQSTRIIIVSVLVMCLIIFAACKEDRETVHDLWPLSPGNVWLYRYSSFPFVDTMKVEVTGTIPLIVDGDTITATKLAQYQYHSSPNVESLYWKGPQGIYFCGLMSSTDTLSFKDLNFKYPAFVGDEWLRRRIGYSYTDRFIIKDTVTFKLIATDEELNTPNGVFKCYVYQYTAPYADDVPQLWDFQYYFAPNIGWVGYFAKDHSNGHIYDEMILINYDLK